MLIDTIVDFSYNEMNTQIYNRSQNQLKQHNIKYAVDADCSSVGRGRILFRIYSSHCSIHYHCDSNMV